MNNTELPVGFPVNSFAGLVPGEGQGAPASLRQLPIQLSQLSTVIPALPWYPHLLAAVQRANAWGSRDEPGQ